MTHAKIFGWYDNEYGSYTNLLGDLTESIDRAMDERSRSAADVGDPLRKSCSGRWGCRGVREATMGVEPMNNGFADRTRGGLNPLPN